MRESILVSACLLGENCRYDGSSKANEQVIELSKNYNMLGICPEVLGGLPTPRPPSEIIDGDGANVLDKTAKVTQIETGNDVTDFFFHGSQKVLEIAETNSAKIAILKERSPSCGVNQIYRNGELVYGMGVTTAALMRKGIKIYSEERIPANMNPNNQEQ
jgi:uncharacterized protein YbbK (DUF523 family)